MATNFVARDGDKLTYPHLFGLCWHLKTNGNVATPIIALTSAMIPRRLIQKFVNLDPINPEILLLICMVGGWLHT